MHRSRRASIFSRVRAQQYQACDGVEDAIARNAIKDDLACLRLGHIRFRSKLNVVAISNGKPVSTFPENALRPPHRGRQRGQDRIDIAAGTQAEDGAAIVEQVELHVTAAAHKLLLARGLAPGLRKIPGDQLGIDLAEGPAHVLGEGEIGLPVAAVEIVVEDAAHAAHLLAVLQKEIVVAPAFEFLVGRHGCVRGARLLHRRMKRDRVGIVLRAPSVQQRSEIGAAAEPGLARHHEARVHVHGRHVRIVQVCDERDAGSPEAWI